MSTWCHCRPVETPALVVSVGVCVEADLYGVGLGSQDLWLDEIAMGWRHAFGPAAASPHQGFPVSILDLDVVPRARRLVLDLKEGELQPHHLSALHLDPLRLVEEVGVI